MKKQQFVLVLVFLVVFCVLTSCASSTSYKEVDEYDLNPITKVIEVPNASSGVLYVRANTWMVDVFKSSEGVIQFSDKDAGVIKGKFSTLIDGQGLNSTKTYQVNITLTIEVKEGKTRIQLEPDYFSINVYNKSNMQSYGIGTIAGSAWAAYQVIPEDVITRIQDLCNGLISQFSREVNTNATDW